MGATEFNATLLFSFILQTLGEWIGTLIGIIGAGAGLFGTIFSVNSLEGSDFEFLGSLVFLGSGVMSIFIGPIIGFSIMILFRFIAEQFRLFASLVVHAKEIAENVKK